MDKADASDQEKGGDEQERNVKAYHSMRSIRTLERTSRYLQFRIKRKKIMSMAEMSMQFREGEGRRRV